MSSRRAGDARPTSVGERDAPPPRSRGWPLWIKVSALLLLASVVPLLLLSALILKRERAMARAANVALLEARVDEIGHTLEAIYRGYRDAAVHAARDPDVVAFCAASRESRSRPTSGIREHLDVFRGHDPAIRGLGLIDRAGTVIAATEPALMGVNLAHREYVQLARRGDEAISDVYVSLPATGRVPSVAFAVPVRAPGGDVVGVYMLWLRAEAVWDVMRAANGTAGRGSFFALFDRFGLRVGHSANEKLLFHPAAPVPDAAASAMLADRRFQERTAELLADVVPFPLHEIQGHERGIFRRPASPTNNVSNLAVARAFPTLRGTLVAHVPESEIEVSVASLIRRVLPALLVALVMVLLGGALMIRHVVWPIRKVAAAAAALERGDLGLEQEGSIASISSGGEVGALARAFRSMAASLAERDRTLRQRNRELVRHQRALLTLSECNEALVRASDERTLLHAVCDIVVRVGGHRMCWVGFAEHDERKTILPVAHAGHEDGYLATADIVWSDTERGHGPVGTAVRTGEPVITRSVESDPSFELWVRDALSRGYHSVAAVPIGADGGTVLGALAIYSEEVDAFDANEMRLLGELANDLTYGITSLRGRAEHLEMTARLVEADRMVAVGTLAAGVAHEINNPLAYVVAALQFFDDELSILEREMPAARLEEVRQALGEAREGAQRVTTIVRDLKTFSRADEERSGPVDLRSVLESSINMAFNELRHRARVVKDFGRIPLVLANDARLGQVFLNLLINAAQAIPEGRTDENVIRVSTRTDDSGRAIIEVRDSGSGIPPEVAPHVFDPFFTTKPVGVGTGLGLYICRNIVTAAGGEIAVVETGPRKGTVIRVALPPAPPLAKEPSRAASLSGNCVLGRRGRILVIDDEPAVGHAIRRLLRAEHDVAVLTSARDARERIALGERYDAIICDVMMPVMTGMDLHADLTTLAPDQAACMILLTGGAFTAAARDFVERWPNPRLDKPVDSADLRAIVRTVVG